MAEPQLSRALLASMQAAQEAAGKAQDDYVSTEHLLVGLAATGGGRGSSAAGEVADLLKGGRTRRVHAAAGARRRLRQGARRQRCSTAPRSRH
jgi:ATP-dependent Clp protease ATP-binding subunit ClpA